MVRCCCGCFTCVCPLLTYISLQTASATTCRTERVVKERYYNKSERKALIECIDEHMARIQKTKATATWWMKDYYDTKLRKLAAQRTMLAFGCKIAKPIRFEV